MKQLLQHMKQLWHEQLSFKMAGAYLVVMVTVILMLPVLPLPYGPNELDLQHIFQAPFSWNSHKGSGSSHWLGTDALGRDVLSNVLYGARSAFLISVPVMLLSTGIGVILGVGSGYFGNNESLVSRAGLLITTAIAVLTCYLGIYLPLQIFKFQLPAGHLWLSYILLLATLLVLYKLVLPFLKRWSFFSGKVAFPLDYVVVRFTEALNSIPNLMLVLVIAAFLPPSVFLLSIVIVATNWTSTARLARAEMLKIRKLPYFEAAKSIGSTQKQLLLCHALPNMLGPIVVTFSFGLASLLTLESTLSFLGIGIPTTFVSWGRTIAGIRANTSAWWLVVFPGSALALTVLAIQTISYHLLNSIQHKNDR